MGTSLHSTGERVVSASWSSFIVEDVEMSASRCDDSDGRLEQGSRGQIVEMVQVWQAMAPALEGCNYRGCRWMWKPSF